MNRLEEQYSDRVEFVWLNIDNSATLPMRQQYDIVGRSQYVLVGPDGSVVKRWFGYLDEASVAAEIDAYLASL